MRAFSQGHVDGRNSRCLGAGEARATGQAPYGQDLRPGGAAGRRNPSALLRHALCSAAPVTCHSGRMCPLRAQIGVLLEFPQIAALWLPVCKIVGFSKVAFGRPGSGPD
jgi:hypothetical protein